jgi:hypothetical protein
VTVTRDGTTILSAVDAGPKIIVTKAVYGVLNDAQRTRDVRERVQQLVDAGEYSVKVARLAEGDDPAFNVLKDLLVEYAVDGKSATVKGNDNDVVYLADAAPPIVIEKAVYGVLDDPARTRDVREKVQHIVDAGETGFQVARLAQGDDPAVNVVKTMIIECTVAGQHKSVTGTDSNRVTLFEAPGSLLMAEAHCSSNGQAVIEAWERGRYVATTAAGHTLDLNAQDLPDPLEVTGPWQVRFPPQWGAPEHVTLDKLVSWSDHSDAGVKYFSGVATYTKVVNVPESLLAKNRRLYLDLGDVAVIAQATLNNKDLGTFWRPPFVVDITDIARPGDNALELKVANLWVNRLLGDEQLPDDSVRNPDGTLKEWPQWLAGDQPSPSGRYTFTTWRLWKKEEALQKSGLVGPVRLRSTQLTAENEKPK